MILIKIMYHDIHCRILHISLFHVRSCKIGCNFLKFFIVIIRCRWYGDAPKIKLKLGKLKRLIISLIYQWAYYDILYFIAISFKTAYISLVNLGKLFTKGTEGHGGGGGGARVIGGGMGEEQTHVRRRRRNTFRKLKEGGKEE